MINKVSQGRPHVVDAIMNGEIQLVVNTALGTATRHDGYIIRRTALKYNIPYATTTACGMAICRGIIRVMENELSVKPLQEYIKKLYS